MLWAQSFTSTSYAENINIKLKVCGTVILMEEGNIRPNSIILIHIIIEQNPLISVQIQKFHSIIKETLMSYHRI